MLTNRGQGTIEYLVIIAIVVVIALIVAGLVFQIYPQLGGGISRGASESAWKTGDPWGISDWTRDSTGKVTLVLKNNSFETQYINSFTLSPTDQNLSVNSPGITAGATYKVTIAPPSGFSCQANTTYTYSKANISIDYNSQNIANKTEAGAADLVGTQSC